LIITVPVAEVEGQFKMEIGSPENPGRVCETKLEILEYGFYSGKPVTKVRLSPVTGRRHQLRVHCNSIGFPIVGDATYNEHYDTYRSERMMLHAHYLCIDLGDPLLTGLVEKQLECLSPDPFPFKSGVLTPILPSYINSNL